ncbi:MAG: hypothetical protein ABIZ05_01945 [Pseudonocardiaceae bacterium]
MSFSQVVAAVLRDARPDDEDGVVKVEQIPAERAQFSTAGTRGHREPQQYTPREIRERGVEDSGGLFGCGRM